LNSQPIRSVISSYSIVFGIWINLLNNSNKKKSHSK
jgi:hypothetical protein